MLICILTEQLPIYNRYNYRHSEIRMSLSVDKMYTQCGIMSIASDIRKILPKEAGFEIF